MMEVRDSKQKTEPKTQLIRSESIGQVSQKLISLRFRSARHDGHLPDVRRPGVDRRPAQLQQAQPRGKPMFVLR